MLHRAESLAGHGPRRPKAAGEGRGILLRQERCDAGEQQFRRQGVEPGGHVFLALPFGLFPRPGLAVAARHGPQMAGQEHQRQREGCPSAGPTPWPRVAIFGNCIIN